MNESTYLLYILVCALGSSVVKKCLTLFNPAYAKLDLSQTLLQGNTHVPMKLVMNTSYLMRLQPREVATALSLTQLELHGHMLGFFIILSPCLPHRPASFLIPVAKALLFLHYLVFGIIVDQLCYLSVYLIIHSFASFFFSHAIFQICFEKRDLIICLVDSYLWVLIYEIL